MRRTYNRSEFASATKKLLEYLFDLFWSKDDMLLALKLIVWVIENMNDWDGGEIK